MAETETARALRFASTRCKAAQRGIPPRRHGLVFEPAGRPDDELALQAAALDDVTVFVGEDGLNRRRADVDPGRQGRG